MDGHLPTPHGDHIGDQKLKALAAGECANSERIPAGPHSTTAEIAASHPENDYLALEVRTSVGIASYPEHGEDIDTLLQHADDGLEDR